MEQMEHSSCEDEGGSLGYGVSV